MIHDYTGYNVQTSRKMYFSQRVPTDDIYYYFISLLLVDLLSRSSSSICLGIGNRNHPFQEFRILYVVHAALP